MNTNHTPTPCPLCNPLTKPQPFGLYHFGCTVAEEFRKQQLERGDDSASLVE